MMKQKKVGKVLEDKGKKIADVLFSELKNYQQTNKTQRSEINDIYNAYIGKMDDVKKVPYFEPISIPKLRTEVSYIVPFIFSGNPELEVQGIGVEDKPIASILEKIVNFRLQTIPKAYETLESWVKQSTTFGTSIMRVNWRFETETRKEQDETGEEVEYEVPTIDEPELCVPNVLDVYYNPVLADIYNQNSIIFRSVLPIKDIKDNDIYDFEGPNGLNRELIKSKDQAGSDRENSSVMLDDEGMDIKATSEGTVEVYERVTSDGIQTVVDGAKRLTIRDRKTNYDFINCVKLIHEPNCIPNRFDGFGVGQNTLGLAKAYHSIVNQTKQNVTLANNPMFYGRKGANIKKKELVAKPGGFITVDGDGAIDKDFKQVVFQDVKEGALNFAALLDNEHKRASGANDILQGATSNETLGQDELANANSSNRFELIQRRFKEALSSVARMLIVLELKNLQSPEADILRIFPDEVPQVDQETGQTIMAPGFRKQIFDVLKSGAEDIKYNIKIKGGTTIAKNKDVQIKQLLDWYDIFADVLPPEQKIETARKILELRGIDEIDKLVPGVAEMQQEREEQQRLEGGPSEGGNLTSGNRGADNGQAIGQSINPK